MHIDNKKQWRPHIKRLQNTINFGWWLGLFIPSSLVLLFTFTSAIFIIKREFPAVYLSFGNSLWLINAALLCIIALFSYHFRKSKFYSFADAALLIDEKLQLNCALVLAIDNNSNWPGIPDNIDTGITLKNKNLGSLLLALGIILSALFIPITSIKTSHIPAEQPTAWTAIEKQLDEMKKNKDIDSESIDELQKKLQKLKNKPSKDWYTHSNLEASDSLRQAIDASRKNMRRNVASAAKTLDRLKKLQQYLKKLEKQNIKIDKNFQADIRRHLERLDKELDDDLKKLLDEALKMNPDLLDKLKNINPSEYASADGGIDPEKLRELLERLKEMQEALGDQPGPKMAGDSMPFPGIPDINRGPGEGGDPLGDKMSEKLNDKIEAVHNSDRRNSLPGELVSIENSKHNIDKTTFKGPAISGDTKNKGDGGDAIWKNTLLPEEQELLKRYFK